ncbi:MAG: serpin family protein [Chloroflexi bacterium]|nr:serpin family protein [Chloroflexota bacterium]
MKRHAVLLVLVAIAACSPAGSSSPSGGSASPPSASPATSTVAPSPSASASPGPSSIAGAIREVRADVGRLSADDIGGPRSQAVVAADAAFGLRLYRELITDGANLIYSPYSISTALSMTYGGARGSSASQLGDVLGVGADPAAWHQGRNDVDAAISRFASLEPSEGVTPLTIEPTNALFGQDGFPFEPGYLELLAQAYGAGLNALDFAAHPDASRTAINAWVAERTKDRIPELLGDGTVTGATRVVLVNAIYFLGSWATPFDKALTKAAPFHRLDGSAVTGQMMKASLDGNYVRAKDWQAIEIPYVGATMTIILPDAGRFTSVESGLDSGTLAELAAHPAYEKIHLRLPRWSAKTGAELKAPLIRLGARDLFDPEAADLSGIADAGLFISFVVHQANIDVDENGTEAAAATAVGSDTTGGGPDGEVTVNVDRPFIFLIRDGGSGEILFAGRVLDPSAR